MSKQMPSKLLTQIRKELKRLSDKKCRTKLRSQVGKKVKIWGVKTSDRKEIAAKYYNQFRKNEDIGGAIALAERLIWTKGFEETHIGIEMIAKASRYFDMHAFWHIERLLDFMSTGYNTDVLCRDILGKILIKFKHETRYLYHWASSTNKWRRRASAVVLLGLIKQGKDVDSGFVIAKKLCGEKNPDVLEALEVLLKALKKADRKRTKKFVEEFQHKLPEYIWSNI